MSGVFLTGATGFVGGELLLRYLERTDRDVFALVRAPDDAAAAERLDAVLAQHVADPGAYAGRLIPVCGDLTRPGLGLSPARRDELAAEVSEIVHGAASVSFGLTLEQAREINVEGTRRVLELAGRCDARGGLRRFSYVSTAYVAGTHRGDFGEDDLDVGQGFRNSYERSKWEAERVVRSRSSALPVQVFRPSIVVGEEETGWTTSFNVIYWPLRAFARGAYPVIPARRSAPVDVVPVSYVADAIFELSTRPSGEGRTFHLTAGRRASSVGEVIGHSARYFRRKPPVVVPPSLYRRVLHPLVLRRASAAQRSWLERSEALFPYFAMGMRFDTSRTEAALDPAGIRAAPLASYLDRLLDFAVAADWGRNPVARPQLLRERAALALAA